MNITLKDLLDAGVHFGHQLRRYNPRSKKYVFDNRHGISIIDLEKTYNCLETACTFVEDLVASGKDILFVGTKRQAQEIIREAATACQMPFCANRWMGGTLTNWVTIKQSIEKYKRYLQMEADGTFSKMHNKEVAMIRHEMSRMSRNFEGIKDMPQPPAAMFVVDTRTEEIAVAEANRLEIPLIGLVDTNSDPSQCTYPVPGNDDSIKSIRIIVETLMEAVQQGMARREVATQVNVKNNITQTGGYGHRDPQQTTEEQLPVTTPAIRRGDGESAGEEEIPESYSTDFDESSK